jgi:hypothetical protein
MKCESKDTGNQLETTGYESGHAPEFSMIREYETLFSIANGE